MLEKAQLNQTDLPLLMLIFGPDGCGKSTFGIDAPNPIVIGKEQGIPRGRRVMCVNPETVDGIFETINDLKTQKHDYKTLVLDSLDWIEPLLWKEVCKKNSWESVESPGYGKGYTLAMDIWRKMIDALTELRTTRGMNIIAIAHCQIKPFNDPNHALPYDRYTIKLNEKAAALWREYVDLVGFANFEVYTKAADGKKAKAFDDGERVLHTVRTAAFDAKNRLGLPPKIKLGFKEFEEALNAGADPKAEIEVLLKNIDPEVRTKVEAALAKPKADYQKILTKLREIAA